MGMETIFITWLQIFFDNGTWGTDVEMCALAHLVNQQKHVNAAKRRKVKSWKSLVCS